MMIRRLALFSVVPLCTACALIQEQVDVAYTSDPSVARARVVGSPEVRLQVTDARNAEGPTWIADKKNGYGMRMASIVAQKSVAELVREAVTQELVARGIRVGEGPRLVSLEVTRMESVYQNRFFSVGAIGAASILVQVKKPDGSIAYARNFSVTNDDQATLLGTPSMARQGVEIALSKIVGQIMADPAFIGSLPDGARIT